MNLIYVEDHQMIHQLNELMKQFHIVLTMEVEQQVMNQ